jgi:hypothetical protein
LGIGALVMRDRGDSTNSRLDFGVGVAVAPDGTVYMADRADGTVLSIGDRRVEKVVKESSLGPLANIAIDTDGLLLLVAGDRHLIRVARDGTSASIVDDLAEIRDVDVASDGVIYVVGGIPARVEQIASDGTRRQVAGPLDAGVAPPPGYVANFSKGVSEIAIDGDGTVLVLSESRLWRVRTGTDPQLVAGSLDPASEVGNGDGGPAEHAVLADPHALAVTEAGYFFCDDGGRHVRLVDRQGQVEPVVSLPLAAGCVDLASVPGTHDVMVLDEKGGVQRVSPAGGVERILGG